MSGADHLPKDSMPWRYEADYRPEMGRVVVWLQWLQHNGKRMANPGQFMIAYQTMVRDTPVWVDEPNCTPIETGGRRVIRFLQPIDPEPEPPGGFRLPQPTGERT